ncbi:hypothetical protein [Saccharopolyspora phatthalungensis]|uniref:Uncharacterized protein n=1 Tax=Saccharopolyspora phatthalungensis TaxID=664693 RepID=A0A840Q7R9_9PSEU|nr:hypothetical protein [Saccharopolyspora phatthalungensis]MBB5156496.1 hypothetical protein [Saccharopolyspora phatthalungensis]
MVITWRDIHEVGKRGHRASPLERMAGVDTQWMIWVVDGRTLWFDSSTDDSEELADGIIAAWGRGRNQNPQ